MSTIKTLASLVFQLGLLMLSYILIIWNTRKEFLFTKQDYLLLPILLLAWLIALWLTHIHKLKYYQKKLKYVLAPLPKAGISMFAICWLASLAFVDENSRHIVYQIVGLYFAIQFAVYIPVVIIKNRYSKSNGTENQTINKYQQEEISSKPIEKHRIDLSGIDNKLTCFTKDIILKLGQDHISDESKPENKIAIIHSEKYEFDNKKQVSYCIADVRVNNIKNINGFFASIYKIVLPGGCLMIPYQDIDDYEKEKLTASNKFSRFIRFVKYYTFHRALPQIRYLNKIHHVLTNGKNKIISKAETWGRLFYAGFEVEDQINEKGVSYIIARKSLTPSANPSPSFYPIIALNRVSLYGKIIKIHKVRSMYPYSEFLQKKVFESGNLNSIGKFGNDFRITKFGKICRKYWIDELPQFIDWFRGEIKLVGIRAMSQHFFSLYPKQYQDLFVQVKPGIVSPIFDEDTDSFDTIVKIEQEYLEKYLKNPVKTDIQYFFLTLKHIFKGTRSK